MVGTLIAAALVWRHNDPIRVPLLPAFGLWIAAGLASLPMAIDPLYSLVAFKGDVLYSILVFAAFFVLTADLAAFALLRRACTASLLVTSLVAAGSALYYGEWGTGAHNALGLYGTFVITTLPLLITTLFPGTLRGGHGERMLTWMAIAAAIYGAFLSQSRSLWGVLAAIGAAALLYAAHRHRQHRRLLLAALVMVIVGALGAAAVVSQQRKTQLTALHDRDRIYAVALDQVARRPLTGAGFGREANREVYKQAFPNMALRHAHNLFLSYAEQMGVGGLLALAALFGTLLLNFRRLFIDADPAAALLGFAGLTLCLAVLLKNMSDMFFVDHNLLLFWAHCGLLLGLGRRIGAVS